MAKMNITDITFFRKAGSYEGRYYYTYDLNYKVDHRPILF